MLPLRNNFKLESRNLWTRKQITNYAGFKLYPSYLPRNVQVFLGNVVLETPVTLKETISEVFDFLIDYNYSTKGADYALHITTCPPPEL